MFGQSLARGCFIAPHRKADAATQCDSVADLALGQMDPEEQVELHGLTHEAAEGPLAPEPMQLQVGLTACDVEPWAWWLMRRGQG